MLTEVCGSGRQGTPTAGEVIEQARRASEELSAVAEKLELPNSPVTDRDCTRVAAMLRGMAKMLDRHAHTRPAPPSSSGSGVWVFPGQLR